MDQYRLYGWLEDHLSITKSTNGWYLTDCPLCATEGKKRVMRLHFEYEYVSCMSISCDWHHGSKFVPFVAHLEGMEYDEAKLMLNTYEPGSSGSFNGGAMVSALGSMHQDFSRVELPYGFKNIKEGEGLMAQRARSYCTGRGFDIEYIDSMGIGYCDEINPDPDHKKNFFGYLIIPFTISGKLVYYIGRNFLGESYRYKNLPVEELGISKESLLFNEDALHIHEEVFLNEGWADALTLGNAVGLAGGLTLSDSQAYKIIASPCKRVIICLDDGAYPQALQMANRLLEHKEVYVLRLEGGDPNELGLQEIIDIYGSTERMDFPTMIQELNQLT